MITTNLIVSLILFFIQPVFIVGLIYAFMSKNRRVNYFREKFRVNFNPKNFEVKDYLLKGLLPGLVLSVAALVIGIPLTLEWYVVYQLVAIILLLISGYRFIHPVFTFSLTSILVAGLNVIDVRIPFNRLTEIIDQNIFTFNQPSDHLSYLFVNILLFMALISFASTFSLEPNQDEKVYPMLRKSKRGKKVAKYRKNSMWVMPLFLIVPGQIIPPFLDWWPVFSWGEMEYALFLAPILVGYHFTVSTQLLEDATNKLRNDIRILALFIVGVLALSYFIPDFSIWAIGMVLAGAVIVLYRHRRRENFWTFKYGPADEGIRIIAVRPDSPAERMELAIGDVILNLNNQEMLDKDDFDKALATKQSYVKLRIKRKDGEIVMTETPLYDNDYNNLGLIVLDD